jgi:hypothetical protein
MLYAGSAIMVLPAFFCRGDGHPSDRSKAVSTGIT